MSLPTRKTTINEHMTRASSGMKRVILNRGLIAETGELPPGYKLIRDSYALKLMDRKNVIGEDMHGKKVPVMKVTGLFQEAEKPNANGRVYPRDVLSEATSILQPDMERRAVYGEYDHPQDAKIHLDRISHLVTKAWMDGNRIFGEAEILDNQPHGACLRGLFERKCQVGISSRGVGDMEMRESAGKSHYYVLPGYMFVTWDAVAEPSVNGANLSVMEALRRHTKAIQESIQTAKKSNNLLSKETYERALVEEIHKFFGTTPITPLKKPLKRKTYSF